MQWYSSASIKLNAGQSYSRQALINYLKADKPNLSAGSYQWTIANLVKEGAIIRKGYNAYALDDGKTHKEYRPYYSESTTNLLKELSIKYPLIHFTVFETILLNDFLNHLIAQNTIYIQAEKEGSIFIFRYLQEHGHLNLMYKPSIKDFHLYWTPNCIVVTDLITEAPTRNDNPHQITAEKMLVDICADRTIASSYNKNEFPEIVQQVQEQYQLDQAKMLRYARRRNRETFIKTALKGY